MEPLNKPGSPKLSTSLQPPGAGGWVPSRLVQVAVSTAAACLSGGGVYLAANEGKPVTFQGVLSACIVASGGYLATHFGIKSAGPRSDVSRFPPQD